MDRLLLEMREIRGNVVLKYFQSRLSLFPDDTHYLTALTIHHQWPSQAVATAGMCAVRWSEARSHGVVLELLTRAIDAVNFSYFPERPDYGLSSFIVVDLYVTPKMFL